MNDVELTDLLANLILQWENEVIEFKNVGDTYSTDNIGKYFSALSNEANLHNSKKSWLVFGVDNRSRTVRGSDFRVAPEHLNSLKIQIKDGTDPSVSFNDIHVLNHPQGRVILFEIPAAPQGIPIAWKGHYYARAGESLVPLGLDKLEIIRNQGIERDWSAQFVPDATFADLDPDALQIARKGFAAKHANRFSPEEIQNWPLNTFLDRAQVTRQGKITRTTILLLGKAESAHHLNPNPAQITWKLEGQERAYEHFGPPFLLNTSNLFNRIRNIQIRILPERSLLAIEVAKYDKRVVLEGLHNCIAHQDYTKNTRIIVTEYIDRLTMYNGGCFYEGDPMDYIYGEKTPSKYRNMMLVRAMTELNMIDAMGYGIHDMFRKQAERGFPLQDYTQNPDSVVVTIYGRVIDEAYSTLLLRKTNLKPNEIICLDRIQKRLPVNSESIKGLRKACLIEGRYPNIHITQEADQVVSSFIAQPQSSLCNVNARADEAKADEAKADKAKADKAKADKAKANEAKANEAKADEAFWNSPMLLNILRYLRDEPMSKKMLASKFNIKSTSGNINRTLQLLLKLNLIEHTQSKQNSPNQAYRITEHGIIFLDERYK